MVLRTRTGRRSNAKAVDNGDLLRTRDRSGQILTRNDLQANVSFRNSPRRFDLPNPASRRDAVHTFSEQMLSFVYIFPWVRGNRAPRVRVKARPVRSFGTAYAFEARVISWISRVDGSPGTFVP